jgi:UDP-glucose 4-epimerase
MHPEPSAGEVRLARLRVAVTGHRGFIGRHLVATLGALKARVVLLEGDVRSPESWTGPFDLLFHLAAVMPHRFAEDPGEGFSVNIEGTLRALEACRARGARMVFTSTCGVYSPSEAGALSEACRVDPQTPYARSKLMAEMLCRSYADHFGVSGTVLRLFNIYGEGQKAEFLVPYLAQCALEGREAVVHHPESSRDFVHVTDVARALVRAALVEGPFEVFNIGLGRPYTVRQVLEAIGRVLGRPVAWRQGEGRPDPQPAVFARIERAEARLGWRPTVGLEQGLRDVVAAMGAKCHEG